MKHVNSQSYCETFVCLWSDCKVFNKSSCSRSWLERHVLSHSGSKPLQCIVQKCRQRFSSQVTIFLYFVTAVCDMILLTKVSLKVTHKL